MAQDQVPNTIDGADGELVDEVTEFHQEMAIKHTDEADRHLVHSLEEYILAGEHLLKVKDRMGHGAFKKWVGGPEYGRSYTQAVKYMRVAKEQKQLKKPRETLSLNAALRELAGSTGKKDEKKDEEKTTAKTDGDDELEALRSAREAAKEADRKRAKHWESYQKEQQARKDAEKKAEDAEKKAEAEREEFTKNVRHSAAQQLADVYARYNIPEIPPMFQSNPEEIQKAIAKTKDKRTKEALEVLSEAMRLVGKMMRYEPEEAAARFLEWHDRDWAKENMERYEKWLTACMEEMRKQTSPGLRALS